jgi:hypothetical protein
MTTQMDGQRPAWAQEGPRIEDCPCRVIAATLEPPTEDQTSILTAVQEHSLPLGPDPGDTQATHPRSGQRPRRSRHLRRVWAQGVAGAVTANRVRMRAIQARAERPLPAAEAKALQDGIESLLGQANLAAQGIDPRHTPFVSWWRGNCIEAAFHNLHRAEAEMVRLYSDAEVDAEIPEAVVRAETGLDGGDLRREAALKLLSIKENEAKRIALSKIVQIGHERADRLHSRLRAFRNIVLVTAVLLALFVSIVVFWMAHHAEALPLCFTLPNGTGHCPNGLGHPDPSDVRVVALLGLLGGALAAAVSIRKIKCTSAPYNVAVALALLKCPAGALTALVGLIAVIGGFVPGLTDLDRPHILAYALLFGYAQQLLTGLIDKQAHSLLGSLPSKDPTQHRTPLQHGLTPITEA